MRFRAVLPILCLTGTGFLSAYAAGPVTLVCRFLDPQIAESSGLASSSRSNQYFFTHNDSGDTARFFAVDRQGRTLATFKVPGAMNVDWEDMARGRDPQGRSVLLLGDIGDNQRKRDHLTLYQVTEPEVDPSVSGAKLETEPAQRFEVRYPDGAHDAETLMFNMTNGQVFILTKSLKSSGLYASKGWLEPDKPNILTKVSWVRFASFPATTTSLTDQFARLLATGGDISPDGQHVVARTYTDAYEWSIVNGDVAASLLATPTHLVLPKAPQGEAVAYSLDGRSILFSSEKVNGLVHELAR